jgi:hypothetical protein
MSWIKEHPEEADIMAKNAHQIFKERFLLENQLLDLKHLFEKIKFNKFVNKN